MSATFTQTGNKGVVTLKGDLTLRHAEEMKKVLLKALLNADSVTVSFGNIREVDLSCLQLLCSAHRSAVRLKKQVAFSEDLPRAMRNAAEVAGYARLKGCRLDCEGSCLWMEAAGARHER
jgi:anti-anti-sigma regulatory factor